MILRFPVSRDSIFLGFAFIFWLVPFFWAGWKGQTWSSLPKSVTFQHTAAGLFTRRTTRWWDQHIEARGMDNKRFEISETAVFRMGAFGSRTRYDRILMETNRSRLNVQVRRRLAEHIFQKLQGNAGAEAAQSAGSRRERLGPPVKSLQLVRSLWTVGSEALANPAGEWNPPPVTEVKGANRQVLGTYQLVAGKVVEIRTPRVLEVPQTALRGTDPGVSSKVNPTGGANSPSGASAVGGSNAANLLPRKRPLVVPPSAADGSSRVSPSVSLPWRSGSPMKPVLPGDPVVKAPNAVGSNGNTLPNGANRRPGQPTAPPMQPLSPQPVGSGVK